MRLKCNDLLLILQQNSGRVLNPIMRACIVTIDSLYTAFVEQAAL